MMKENKNSLNKAKAEKTAGERAVEYAQQMAWLISLRKMSYITDDEYDEAHKRLNMKYHQPSKL